jgi:hypothetical protein
LDIIKSDLLDDISQLTTVQRVSIDRLVNQGVNCICHDIQELKVAKSDCACIDIGLGNLFINISNNEIKYRFEPSSKLESGILNTVLTGKSPVIDDIEKSLINKVNTVYKELF